MSHRSEVIGRRITSVSMVLAVAVASVLLVPVAVPLLVLVDLLRLRVRLPLVRLYTFALCWSWLELAGVSAAAALWSAGRRRDLAAHYRLQAWWADKVMTALRITCGLRPQVNGAEVLTGGPTILLARHASLADSLLIAWIITHECAMRPRVVMKRELLVDPCLDIVGNRLPNCFVDRGAVDSAPELAAISAMTDGLGAGDVAVLFPEGTRANDAKRTRALESIRRRDAPRADRLASLVHLLPPRPSGAASMLAAAPGAAVSLGWHVGFEGLDSFRGIIGALGRKRTPVQVDFALVGRPPEVTPGPAFEVWLDARWCELDAAVDQLLTSPPLRHRG